MGMDYIYPDVLCLKKADKLNHSLTLMVIYGVPFVRILEEIDCHNDTALYLPAEMSCMLLSLEDKTIRLRTDCRAMLEERVAMWEYAAKVRIAVHVAGMDKKSQAL